MNYDLCVLGLGYIGLPTASVFATKGRKVLGVDVVPQIVETINSGRIHIEEPDLDLLVRAAVRSGNLVAASRPAAAGVYIIAVPTPFSPAEGGRKVPDLTYVEQAARSVAPVIETGALVILESTSPVGTTEKVRAWIAEELGRSGRAVDPATLLFAHCPERILPGQMLKELVANDRIAGGVTPAAAARAKELYQTFCTGEIFLTDARTAELAKLTENAYRDVNIAFANELSLVCEKLGIDVWELIKLANRHPRVKILQPGPGVGGHCIAVDPWFIVDAAPDLARLIRTAREVNDSKPHHVIAQIKAKADRFKEPTIACFGLTFKPDVDDIRESPALEIVTALAEQRVGKLLVVEPHVRELPAALAAHAATVRRAAAEEAIAQADLIVLLVNHRAFQSVGKLHLRDKLVIDTRGLWR